MSRRGESISIRSIWSSIMTCRTNRIITLHRIGRTGRAGKDGKAYTLITPREHGKIKIWSANSTSGFRAKRTRKRRIGKRYRKNEKWGFHSETPLPYLHLFLLLCACALPIPSGSCIPHRFLPTATLIRSICIYVPTGCSGTAFLANKLHLRHHTHLVWNCSRLPCGYNARDTFAFSAPPLSFLYNSAVESGFSSAFFTHLREPCSTVTDIFKPSTANSKILFRDPFRATLKPTSGTVRACPTSRIRNRTLVSRPFFFRFRRSSGPPSAEVHLSLLLSYPEISSSNHFLLIPCMIFLLYVFYTRIQNPASIFKIFKKMFGYGRAVQKHPFKAFYGPNKSLIPPDAVQTN